MQASKNEKMLIAMVPDALKDDWVDLLMSVAFISGFSLFKIQGFSKEHSQFNIKEQVEGYQDFFRFEVAHQQQDTVNLIEILRTATSENNIRYWLVPIEASGCL